MLTSGVDISFLPQSSLVIKGSLSNDNGDVNENGKKEQEV